MFLAVSVDKDLRGDVSIPVPWPDERRWIIMKGKGTVQVSEHLKMTVSRIRHPETFRPHDDMTYAWVTLDAFTCIFEKVGRGVV
jgi:hypothetical protein